MTEETQIHYNNHAEVSLLASMMVNPQMIVEIEAEFPNVAEFFFDFRHRVIFQAMRTTGTSDIAILHPYLREVKQLDSVGGVAYLSGLFNQSTGLYFEAHGYAEALRNDYVKRRLNEFSIRIGQFVAEHQSAADALADSEKALIEIGQAAQSSADQSMDVLMQQVEEDLSTAIDNKGQKLIGLATGFRDFDRMTQGLKGGQMITIAARPGVGKTSLAMNIVDYVAVDQKLPVGVFSLEMTGRELVLRMVCARGRINSSDAQDGNLFEDNKPALFMAMREIKRAPIQVCDKGGLTIAQLGARARRMAIHYKIQLLVIDYLQLMTSRLKENGNARVTEISNGVKTLAKDLNIPVIVLSQLNRDSEKENRKPRLSDLRESGSIEQDSDLVMLLHPEAVDNQKDFQKVECLIPKHRNGPVGKFELNFKRNITRFYDMELNFGI